ncbi:hypothetical protein [Streptomyces chilikensis]|uniref:DUF3618 domain-containing protein n=1 Tax=Streptomyces chilikensis TaxID=1194079 RepID=A0ABV3EUB8_9ACTN
MSESVQPGTGTTGDKVRNEASSTVDKARQGASQVAGTAAEQAQAVVGEARQQAGTVVDDLRSRAKDEADEQTRRAAGALRRWAEDFSGLAAHARGDSPARTLVAQAADRGNQAADYLENQGVDGLVSDLEGFARRRPGAFLGGAVLAGMAVGRLARAAKAASGPDGSDGSDGSGREQPRVSGTAGVHTPITAQPPPGPPAGSVPGSVPGTVRGPSGGAPDRRRPYPEV